MGLRRRQVAAAVSAMAAPADGFRTHAAGQPEIVGRELAPHVPDHDGGELRRVRALLETGKGRPVPDDVKVYVGE